MIYHIGHFRMPRDTQTDQPWAHIERVFLLTFLLSRLLLLLLRFGMGIGFDNDEHLEMVGLVRLDDLLMSPKKTFYAYHPPLGFFLAQWISFTGISQVVSVQLVSFAASLGAFFSLRATLKTLGLLTTGLGVFFLYFTSSIPIQLYLGTSVNLDVLVLLWASVTLWSSVAIVRGGSWERRIGIAVLPLSIALGMFSKFSGAVTSALPFLVGLMLHRKGAGIRMAVRMSMLTVLGVLLVMPYYLGRYYVWYGMLFPGNNQLFPNGHMERAYGIRDEDPVKFVVDLFRSTPSHKSGWEFRDAGIPRLLDTWKDLWIADHWLTFQPNLAPTKPQFGQPDMSKRVSVGYIFTFPYLLVAGLLLWFWLRKTASDFARFGGALFVFSIVQALSLVIFLYDNPFPWTIPTKGIYIAPVVWGVGFLVTCAVSPLLLPYRTSKGRSLAGVLGALALFMVVNHALPVY